jgi:DNA polymerase-3 subunit alpha
MFGTLESNAGVATAMPEMPPWSELQKLYAERQSLGLYLTGHPVKVHLQDLERFTTCRLNAVGKQLPEDGNKRHNRRGVEVVLAGLVVAQRRNRRGHFVAVEDHTGRIEVALYDEVFAQSAELLEKDAVIVVEGRASRDDFSGGFRMTASHVMSLADAKSRFARGVRIALRGPGKRIADQLEATFAPYRSGVGTVYVDYRNERARAGLELSRDWRIKPCEELVAALNELDDVSEARLIY